MEHTEAIQRKLAERYLLGELAIEEKDRFEEHFFECTICADDVEAGAEFLDNLRNVLKRADSPQREPKPWVAGSFWIPLALAAMLLLFTAYQNAFVIPGLRRHEATATPQIMPAFSLLALGSRAGQMQTVSAPKDKPFGLDLEIPGDARFSAYTVEIADRSGTPRITLPVSAEEAKDAIRLTVPAGTLSAGEYQMIMRGNPAGGAPEELNRYTFRLEYK